MPVNYSSLLASPYNWTVLSTQSPNGTVASYTFSSLSGYKAYKIVFSTTFGGSSSQINLNINGDSGANYAYGYNQSGSSTTGTTGVGATKIELSSAPSAGNYFGLEALIEHANVAATKTVKYSAVYTSGIGINQTNGFAVYRTTSTISSLTVAANNGTSLFNLGTITLLGAN